MKKIKNFISITAILTLLVLAGCGAKKPTETNTVVYASGDMIDIRTPHPGDSLSWALVTGKASMTQGFFEVILQGKNAEQMKPRGVNLAAKAPDTVEFVTSIAFSTEEPPLSVNIRAYSPLAQNAGEFLAAVVPVTLIPGSSEAHGAILRYYNALDTNDFDAAYEMLMPSGQNYPALYGGEAIFAPRPKMKEFKESKPADERIRVLMLRPQTMYDLPGEGLFCYSAKIEHATGDDSILEETYIFLVRQEDGSFLLYKSRKNPHSPDQ